VERPDDALDSVVLIDGAMVRGVVISDDASALTIRLRSGEEQVVPRAQVRALNRWRPAPLPAPHREGGPLIVSEDGSAVLTEPGGLRTQLDPLAFYKLVGRDDLAEALARRTSTRQAMVLSGAALASLGGLVLVGDLVADLIYGVSHVCFTYADCTAPPPGTSSNPPGPRLCLWAASRRSASALESRSTAPSDSILTRAASSNAARSPMATTRAPRKRIHQRQRRTRWLQARALRPSPPCA
jgi:hypothetical protein